MKISLVSKSSFAQNELYRSSLLQERCLVSEQRQTVRGPFPLVPGDPDASPCFADDSVPDRDSGPGPFSSLPSVCLQFRAPFSFGKGDKQIAPI